VTLDEGHPVTEQTPTAAPRIVKPYARLVGDDRQRFRSYVVAAYTGGQSIRAVAADTGASFGRVRNTLVAANVPRRSKGWRPVGGGQ
jgi:hypothetical protein